MAVPKLSRIIQEFEDGNSQTEENESGSQNAFCKDVLNTLSSFMNLATRI